jgi:hypothetical protein
MWGRSLIVVGIPFAVLLLLIALAFAASPLFAVILAALVLVAVAVGYALKRGSQRVSKPGEPDGSGRPSGAPVAGEGSGSTLAPSE